MYNNSLVKILLVILCLSNLLFSQQQTRTFRGRVGKAMEYNLVHQERLNPDVANILYLPEDENGLRKPDLLVIGKRRENNGLADDVLINFSGKEVIKDSLTDPIRLHFSENLQYIGIQNWIRRSGLQGNRLENGLTSFQLIDRAGNKLFEKENELPYDLPFKDYEISNSGVVFEIDHTNLTIALYDRNGNLKAEKKFTSSNVFDLSKGIKRKLNNSAKALALFTLDYAPETLQNLIQIFVVDFNLNFLFQKVLEDDFYGHIDISDNGKTIIWSSSKGRLMKKKGTHILNLSNNNMNSIDQFLFTQSEFYGEDLVILSALRTLILYDLHNFQQLFHRYNNKDILAFDYAQGQELIFILEGIRGRQINELDKYWNVQLKVFNLNQVPAFELDLGNIQHKSKGDPFVSCSNDAKEFIFKIGDEIYTYQAAQ